MLSRNAKKVFTLTKQSKDKRYAYSDLKKDLGWEYDDVKSACAQIIDAGLAMEKDYSPMPGHYQPWGIVLKEEGRNSGKYFWAKVGEFLFKSIAIPVLVAVVTAFVTAYITAKVVSGG